MSGRWIVVLAVAAVAGCGSEPTLRAGTARGLHADVAAARAAAENEDRDEAVGALEALERRIGRAESRGELSADAADVLQRGAARARRRAEREIAEPQPTATAEPTATPVPTTTATPEPKGKPEKPGKGNGRGKEKDD